MAKVKVIEVKDLTNGKTLTVKENWWKKYKDSGKYQFIQELQTDGVTPVARTPDSKPKTTNFKTSVSTTTKSVSTSTGGCGGCGH